MSEQHTKDSSQKTGSRRETVTLFIAVISLIGVVLTLAGLDVALAVEAQFGIPHALLLQSPFDLLDLSVIAVTELIVGSGGAYSDWGLYAKAAVNSLPVVTVVVVGWIILAVVARLLVKSKWQPETRTWFRRLLEKPSLRRESMAFATLRAMWYGLIVFAGSLLGTLIAVLVLAVAGTMLAIIPIVSLQAGESYIEKYVVGPERCYPLANRVERLQRLARNKQPSETKEGKVDRVAYCVLVRNTEKLVAQGRVVFGSSSALVLFDPETGTVRSVSVSGLIVETIGELSKTN